MSLAEQVGNESADIEDVIEGMIRMNQLELNTCLPGKITSYDAFTQTCSVQPAIARTQLNGAVFSRAEIDEVPVVFPRSSTGGVTFPLAAGDGVMLIFSQRSIEKWGLAGIEGPAGDTRLHDITDAIAVPGLFPLTGAITPPQAQGTELRGDPIRLGKTGTSSEPFVLGNVLQKNLEDLITAVEELVALITKDQPLITPIVAGGPGDGLSIIVTTDVEVALAEVAIALPAENSTLIFGEL
jgi:hypothetical protein